MHIPWKTYSLVLFDFDDTLVDFAHSERAAVTAVCKSFGRETTGGLIDKFRVINRQLWAKHDCGEISRDAVFHERFQLFLRELNVTGDPETANNIFLGALAEEVAVISNALELLEYLSPRARVGLISNGHGPTQRQRVKRAGLFDLIHFYVVSDEVGVSKPDKKIFDIAYQLSGLPGGMKTLMVGDNFHADIIGAHAVGFDTCWISNGQEAPSALTPTYKVRSVQDLIFK